MSIKKTTSISVIMLASLLMAGCQTQGLYHWGDYEEALYDYYKDPAEQAALSKELLTVIEESNGRVPPGMYAEYGTLLLQQGKQEEAALYFNKEKQAWPESQHLMDSLIDNVTRADSEKNKENNEV